MTKPRLRTLKNAAKQKAAQTKLAADTAKLNTVIQSLATPGASMAKSINSSGQVSDIYAAYDNAALTRLAQSLLMSCAVYNDHTLPNPTAQNDFLAPLCTALESQLPPAIPALLQILKAQYVGN